jgi:hypothetical protein
MHRGTSSNTTLNRSMSCQCTTPTLSFIVDTVLIYVPCTLIKDSDMNKKTSSRWVKINLLSVILIVAIVLLNCDKRSQMPKAEQSSQIEAVSITDTSNNKPVTTAGNKQDESDDSLCSHFTRLLSEKNTLELLHRFLIDDQEYINELESKITLLAEAAACVSKTQRFKEMVRQTLTLKGNADATIDLQQHVFILQRAKTFLEKHDQIRTYLAENIDIQNNGYWTANPLLHFKKALRFWLNRQSDGTKNHFEIILQETIRSVQQESKLIPSDTVKQSNYKPPVFFCPAGLHCDPTVDYLFDKKHQLFLTFLEDFFIIEHGLTGLAKKEARSNKNKQVEIISQINDSEDQTSGEIRDRGMMDSLMNLNSIYFRKELDYYALFRENNENYSWKKVTIKPRLFVDFITSCLTIDILKLDVSTNGEDSVILFSGIPRSTKLKPSGYIPLPQPFSIELSQPCTKCDTTNLNSVLSDTAWEWKIPNIDKNIKRLFAAGWHGHYEGRFLALIELYVENSQGDRIKLDDNSFCGHMWCNDASISNPFLNDANGDGLTDIVIEASDNERILYLQLPAGGFEKQVIQPYATHRSGGC